MVLDTTKLYEGKICSKDETHGRLQWRCNSACVECSRIKQRNYMRGYRTDPEKMLQNEEWRNSNRPRMAWLYARRRARQQGVPFTITVDGLPPVPERCPVLGIPLSFGSDTPIDHSPSLDKIVPSLGYVPGNVHWISHRANSIKRDASVEELRKVAEYFTRLEEGESDRITA